MPRSCRAAQAALLFLIVAIAQQQGTAHAWLLDDEQQQGSQQEQQHEHHHPPGRHLLSDLVHQLHQQDAAAALQDAPPGTRGETWHQPGSEFGAAAAPRPGHSKQQQVFGPADGLSSSIQAQAAAAAAASNSNSGRPKVPLLTVTCMSACMALMSCLGVLPYFFCNKLSAPWAGIANAVASGVMLAASFGLLAEGAPYGGTYLILGMLLGVVFVKFSQEHLEQYEVDSFEQLAGADARKVILFLAVMAVHAVGEGGGVGVSFAGDRGWAQGTLVTLAIGLHNVPEGLAVATVMAAKGTSPRRTLLWTALTALPQALVAPPAYVFVETFKALLPLAMGFAAGCMIWVVLAELLPDALEAVEPEKVATCATGSAAWLQGLSIWIAHLETPDGTLASPFGNYTAVLPLGITPLLPQLAPVIILPALLAAAGTRLSLPPVLLTAASAGLMAAYSGACWLQLLVSSPHKVLGGMLAPAVGAAVAAALWRQLCSWQQQSGWSGLGVRTPRWGTAHNKHAPGSPSLMFMQHQQQQQYACGGDSILAVAAGGGGAGGFMGSALIPTTVVPDVAAAAAVRSYGGAEQEGAGGCYNNNSDRSGMSNSHWCQEDSSNSSSCGDSSRYYQPLQSNLPRLGQGLQEQQQMQQQEYQPLTHHHHHHQQQQQQHMQHQTHQHHMQHHQQQYGGVVVPPQVLTTPAAPYWGSNTTQLRHQRASSESGGNAGGVGVGVGGTAAAPGGSWEDQQSAAGTSSSNSSNGSSSNSPTTRGVAGAGGSASAFQLLPGKGDVLLNVGGFASATAAATGFDDDPGFKTLRKKRDSWGFAGPAFSRVQGSSQAVSAASMLSLGGVAAAGVPLGLQLAAALTVDPTNSGHVVVPMVLLGCLLSLGCLGFLLLLLSSTRKHAVTAAAACVSSMPVVVAIAALLSQPAWISQGSARVAADGLQGLAAGFNLLVLLLLLLPTVRQWGPKAASVGAWGGAVGGCAVLALVAGLCFGTPYCLRVYAPAGAAAGGGSSL